MAERGMRGWFTGWYGDGGRGFRDKAGRWVGGECAGGVAACGAQEKPRLQGLGKRAPAQGARVRRVAAAPRDWGRDGAGEGALRYHVVGEPGARPRPLRAWLSSQY